MFEKMKGQLNSIGPTQSGRSFRGRVALFLFAAVGLVAALGSALVVIPAGHVGVYDLFGKVADQSMTSGIHLVNPLATVHKISVRTQEVKETVDVPSLALTRTAPPLPIKKIPPAWQLV
jgi:regulator of protease activity HflC (stomatin/prohibitin superfamily)